MRVEGLALLGQGGEAAVYALDDERVLRLFDVGTRLEDVTRRTELLAEIADRAAHLPFETPIVLDQTMINGRIATIEKRIVGVSMDEALKMVEGAARQALIESYLDTAVLVAEITIERPFFGEMCRETPITAPDWHTFLMCRAEKSLGIGSHEGTKVEEREEISSRKGAKAQRMIEDVVAQLPDVVGGGQFVHLDYFPGNVMVHEGRVSAVIDFGYACVIGDGRIMPCLATAYLTLGRTADVAQADMDVAHAWMVARGYDALYPAVVTWLAMYWMFVPTDDDPMARAWCLSVLGEDFLVEDFSPEDTKIEEREDAKECAKMIEIRAEHPHSDVAMALIDGLNRAIWERYPDVRPDNSETYQAHNLLSADTPFFVAWRDGEPVGCGAYRPMDEQTIEVKRMYTVESARRLGVGKAILKAVEDAGQKAGFSVARLETGTAQTEAIALYEKEGYVRIRCWPPYDALPVSICMEKMLIESREGVNEDG